MSATTEVSGDTRYIEPIATGTKTELLFCCTRFLDEKSKIRSFDGGKNFVDELGSEFTFGNPEPIEDFLCDNSADDSASSE